MSNSMENKKIQRAKKIAGVLSASLIGISAASVVGAIIGYDSYFVRYERPNYALYPGMYCYERFEDSLPRKTLRVPSGDIELAAYYYPVESPKGLVVVVHGIHAGADDYLPLIEAMVKGGYAVFAYDATGHYDSGGEDAIGMCQQLVDLDRVLTWLGEHEPYAQLPKLLIGHSWGGYAVSSALALHPEVKACVCLAPMCDGTTIMVEKSREYVSDVAYTVKPVFDAYQKHMFGDYINYNGVVGINATQAPVLIAQGLEDTVITPNEHSITAYMDSITNPNVTVYYGEGLQGTHTGIWHSAEAETYARSVKQQMQELEQQKGSALADEEKAAFYETVDHRLYSDVNAELVALIFETFEKGLEN